jgi:Zn-finger nucleic acid-binding protein
MWHPHTNRRYNFQKEQNDRMSQKRTEDEWFARHERDLIDNVRRERERREQRVAEAMKAEEAQKRKELHWLKCPKCGSDMLQEPLQEKVMVDRCGRCGGIFFDRGELEDILLKPLEKRKSFRIGVIHLILPSWKSKDFNKEEVVREFETDRDRRKKDVDQFHSTKEGKALKDLHFMKCPKDGSDLKETDLKHGLFVDDCTLCRGIFLDYGELQIISALTEEDRKDIRDRILSVEA